MAEYELPAAQAELLPGEVPKVFYIGKTGCQEQVELKAGFSTNAAGFMLRLSYGDLLSALGETGPDATISIYGEHEPAMITQHLLAGGRVVLDTDRRELHVDGMQCELTPKEYGVFLYLYSHLGKVRSRDQILATVWEDSYRDTYIGDVRTVDVHVRRLRNKLGDEHRGMLKTKLRFGYMLDDKPSEQAIHQ